jgi:hypothetical protein
MASLITCWLALWVRWLMLAGNLPGRLSVSPPLMLVTLITGAFITRWAIAPAQNNLQLKRPQQIIAVSGLIAILIILWITFGRQFPVDYFYNFTQWGHLLSAEALALLVAVSLWWQAIRIGRDDDLHATARREFSGGLLALTALFILNKLNPHLTNAETFWPTLLFFAVGLGTLAIAGFEQDRRIQKSGTGPGLAPAVSRHWLGTVGAIIGFILAGAIMVTALVDPDSLTALDSILNLVGTLLLNVVGFLVYLIAIVILPIAEVLARALLPLLRLLTSIGLHLPSINLGIPTPEEITAAAQQLARTPPFRFIEVVIILGLIALIFVLAVRRFRLLEGNDSSDETHESIFSRELLWSQIKNLFAQRSVATLIPLPPYLLLDSLSNDPQLIVRRAYQTMLQWANTQPRTPQQTPLAYAQALSNSRPQARAALTLLTEVYVRARYGQHISADEARQAEQAVQQIVRLFDPEQR